MSFNCILFFVQCRSLKIHIAPGEKVPMQVDGEAWLQEPGIVSVVHKNRARMLAKNKVSIEGNFITVLMSACKQYLVILLCYTLGFSCQSQVMATAT